jgi:hypothetical protein
MKTKILIHMLMIVIGVGSLRRQLAYVYASYTYDSHTGMNQTRTLIVWVVFLRAWQSYAYETKTYFYLSFRCAC